LACYHRDWVFYWPTFHPKFHSTAVRWSFEMEMYSLQGGIDLLG